MKFKRMIGLLVATFILMANTMAFAAEEVLISYPEGSQQQAFTGNYTQEEAEKQLKSYIKDYFEMDADLDSMQASLYFREDWQRKGKYIWEMNLNSNARDSYLSIHAAMSDENGQLTSLRKYEGSTRDYQNTAQITKSKAVEIAYQFLKRVNPEIMKELVHQPRNEYAIYGLEGYGLNAREYSIYFERQKDGIPFLNDGVHIGVNNATGAVNSYQYQWTTQEIPEATNIIKADIARKAFEEKLDFNLNYIPIYNGKRPYSSTFEETRLIFTPNIQGGYLIDAHTGEYLEQYPSYTEEKKRINVTDQEKASFEKLSKVKTPLQKELTKDEAYQLANEILEELYGEVKIESSSYMTDWYYFGESSNKVWELQFAIGSNRVSRGSITLDSKTGEVLRINYYDWIQRELMMSGETFDLQLQWEDAYQKAIETIKRLYPEKLKEVETEQVFYETKNYYNNYEVPNLEFYFNFSRKINEITFNSNSIQVSFDATTGLLQNFSILWNDGKFQEPKNLISKEEALSIYMSQMETQLAYGVIPGNGEASKDDAVRLVYRNISKSPFIYQSIDAKTGEYIDYRGNQVDDDKQSLKSAAELFKGHWAEQELNVLYDNGIIDMAQFNLTDVATKNEVIRMMVRAMGGYYYYYPDTSNVLEFTDVNKDDPYYQDIQMAVFHGIIDNEAGRFEGEAQVTREALAALLIKMGKLEKIAKLKEIYQVPVSDMNEVDPELLGHTALIYGFGVLKGDGERYYPKSPVTIEEAAIAIYRSFMYLLPANRYY